MFGFGYLLVPIYDVFCDITGLNGKTGTIESAEAKALAVDEDRLVTVEFDTNVRALPWEFRSRVRKMKVHPGEVATAVFIAENKSSRAVVGRAIPSVAPAQAAVYFNKTDCFCFVEQRMEPGERREMAVAFVVDPDLPERFSAMVLSYTFFDISEKSGIAQQTTEKAENTRG